MSTPKKAAGARQPPEATNAMTARRSDHLEAAP